MSVKQIIQEAVEKNPLGLKEALQEELRTRIATALEEMMNEEVEQIDELSKDTLRSYTYKAVPDFFKTKKSAEKLKMTPKNAGKIAKAAVKLRNRATGVSLATKKMTEEAEQLDEISKETVASYAGKAFRQANTLLKHSLSDQPKSVEKASKAAFKRRQFGIKAAGRRLDKDQMNAIHAAAKE